MVIINTKKEGQPKSQAKEIQPGRHFLLIYQNLNQNTFPENKLENWSLMQYLIQILMNAKAANLVLKF